MGDVKFGVIIVLVLACAWACLSCCMTLLQRKLRGPRDVAAFHRGRQAAVDRLATQYSRTGQRSDVSGVAPGTASDRGPDEARGVTSTLDRVRAAMLRHRHSGPHGNLASEPVLMVEESAAPAPDAQPVRAVRADDVRALVDPEAVPPPPRASGPAPQSV